MIGASRAAPILTLGEYEVLRSRQNLGVVVATSGGYDPIHPGHISCMLESQQLGDTLVVIVNGDAFLTAKKGRPFQDLRTRAAIVAAIRGVDYVVAFEIEGDSTVGAALDAIRPKYFTKGGDRVPGNLPASEQAACDAHGIEIRYGVGLDKAWSSTDALTEWGRFWAKQERD